MEIARWALRALPRLPAAARTTEAALLLALGAAERMGGRAVLPLDGARGAALEHAAWILPPRTLADKIEIGLRPYVDGLELVEPDAAPVKISLPKTTPLFLQVSWLQDGERVAQAVSVAPGRRVALPRHATEIRLRTLAGDTFALEEDAASGMLRPREHDPIVFVGYSRIDFGPGDIGGNPLIQRLRQSLSSASLRPWIDVDHEQVGEDWTKKIAQAISVSDGAALVMSPLLRSPAGSFELMAAAYRRWAKSDYPVAAFEIESRSKGDSAPPQPRGLQGIRGLPIERATDAQLADYVVGIFGPLTELRDEISARAAVGKQLRGLILSKPPEKKWRDERQSAEDERAAEAAAQAILASGVFADIGWDWLQKLSRDEGKSVVEMAAMFSFPPAIAPRVRAAAAKPKGGRAICLNAMPLNVARALINRAWIGAAAPTSLVFREQKWPALGARDDAPTRVRNEVQRALGCDEKMAYELLQTISAPLYLIFATRPLPPRDYIAALQRELPHAVLFFLGAAEPDRSLLAEGLVTELPRIEKWGEFLRQYKRLMEIAAPRNDEKTSSAEPEQHAPPKDQAPSKRPVSKDPASPKRAASKDAAPSKRAAASKDAAPRKGGADSRARTRPKRSK